MKRRAVFVGHELYRKTGYASHHPLAIPRVAPVMDLCRALGWLEERDFCLSPRASDEQLALFHTPEYLAALRRAAESGMVEPAARQRHGLGTMENPLFPGLLERAATSVGGSIRAAEIALSGRLAFHPAGGTHHGRPDRASGFCYFNDPVFAILTLLGAGIESLLYVDLDAHHGDGVEDAFAADPRVHTVSIHERGRWPYTGERSKGRNWNFPVAAGFDDAALKHLVESSVMPLAERIAPEAVVITCGADALAGDPLSSMALSNVALWALVERLVALAPAAVVLGGGGYNPWTVARYWSGLWGRLSGRDVPVSLPASAQTILRALRCDLIDDEEVCEAWLTTLADAPETLRAAA
jgi:acetoin utilization protein AcuC